MQTQPLLASAPHSYLQPFEAIKSMHSFDINFPTFTSKHDMNSCVAKPRTIVCNLSNPHAQTLLGILSGGVIPSRFRKSR